MKTSPNGIAAIKHFEDVRKYMYLDQAGLPTIGVGHLLTKDELSSGKIFGEIRWADGLTDEEVDTVLEHDLAIAEHAVNSLVSVALSQNQFDALVSFVFNEGAGAFAGSTLLLLLNVEGYAGVPGQLRRWVWSAGRRLVVLAERREKEIEMWLA